MNLDYLGDLAQAAFLQAFPSTQWANRLLEPYRGLPFGPYIHVNRPSRPRALTAPLDPSQHTLWHRFQILTGGQDEQQTHDQSQSPFFSRLPADVRLIIYEMVLGHMVFHLSAQNHHSRILLFICNQPQKIGEAAHECHALPYQQSSLTTRGDHSSATGLLPLLVTCRRAYAEAIHILYATNTFEFRQSFAAFRFLRTMIPQQRLHSIRHFRLHMRVPHHPAANDRSRRDWQSLFTFFETETDNLLSLFLRLQLLQPIEDLILKESEASAQEWILPMVRMAVQAYRKRGCKMELMTGAKSHDCVAAFKSALSADLDEEEAALVHACATIHQAIRSSFVQPE